MVFFAAPRSALIISRKASKTGWFSLTVLPMSRSVITEADADEIEQPWLS